LLSKISYCCFRYASSYIFRLIQKNLKSFIAVNAHCSMTHQKQLIQNTLARVVTRVNRRQHITPALTYLHWLPITARIEYKIAMLTLKTLKTNRPAYLADLIQPTTNSTRSATQDRLQVTYSRTSFARRAFVHSPTTIWASLPSNLTSKFASMELLTFKRHLKTFFNQSYYT